MPDQLKSGQVEISFEQGEQFRVIQVDGVWGGVTPNGGIAMGLFYEHAGLPSTLTITVDEGHKAKEVPAGGGGLVRVIETEARMTPSVARLIATWLVDRADAAESFLRTAEQQEAETNPSESPKEDA